VDGSAQNAPCQSQTFAFGEFDLLPKERLLLRCGEPIALTGKAFDLLVALVRRASVQSGRQPPLTRNQVELMKIDTTASESLPGFRALRISSRSLEDELEAILRQNKPRVLLGPPGP
jgi:hypothetical protein